MYIRFLFLDVLVEVSAFEAIAGKTKNKARATSLKSPKTT